VVDRSFLPGTHALLVPKTADGRVLFAVPWLGKTILGTTDTPRDDIVREPTPFADEVAFILGESARYLAKAPTREDVRSVWVGLRPLVKPGGDDSENTKAISREHTVLVGRSGLVTVTGGKWTTYRAMAEDVLDRAMARGLLPRRPAGVTEHLALVGAAPGRPLGEPPGEHLYGSEAPLLRSLPGAANWLWRDGPGGLSEAMVRFAARYEMAREVADVLARRSRLLFLDAAEAERVADAVAAILKDETGRGVDAAGFRALAAQYRRLPG
jgi:glycerol-3-phosphate dehydrogenase